MGRRQGETDVGNNSRVPKAGSTTSRRPNLHPINYNTIRDRGREKLIVNLQFCQFSIAFVKNHVDHFKTRLSFEIIDVAAQLSRPMEVEDMQPRLGLSWGLHEFLSNYSMVVGPTSHLRNDP